MRPFDTEPGDIHIEQGTVPVSSRWTLLGFGVLAIIVGIGLTFALDVVSEDARKGAQVAASNAAVNHFKDISLVAQSAIVVDIENRKTLFALHPETQLPLASLTKVPLAMVVSEVLPENTVMMLPRDMFQIGFPERLRQGESWTVRDILDFTLVASSNEGAEILADAADARIRSKYPNAPSGNAVLWRMNELAKELGLSETYFLNVSGLDESTTLAGAYGSARDVALLFAYAGEAYQSALSATARGDILLKGPSGQITVHNTNLVEGAIPGLILGKTGFTDLAGGNLAVVFDVGIARPVVTVVLGSTPSARFDDIEKLVEAARKTIAAE